MKNLFNITIFISVLFSFFYTGCEKADLQKSTPNDTVKITTRVAECEDCPNMTDCCCSLSFVGTSGSAILKICGTTDGDAVTCSAEQDGCETIDGLTHSQFTLNSGNSKELFCMLMVRGFYIENLGSSTVNLQLTCQEGTLSPQTLNISIPAYSRKYYQTNSQCEVEECGHG